MNVYFHYQLKMNQHFNITKINLIPKLQSGYESVKSNQSYTFSPRSSLISFFRPFCDRFSAKILDRCLFPLSELNFQPKLT